MTSDSTGNEVEVAGHEGKVHRSKYYLQVVSTWTLLSAAPVAAFSWVVISGFKSFPREAQYWRLGFSAASLALSLSSSRTKRTGYF